VSQWPPWLMPSVWHDIVVMSTFHSLVRHRGAPDMTSGFIEVHVVQSYQNCFYKSTREWNV